MSSKVSNPFSLLRAPKWVEASLAVYYNLVDSQNRALCQDYKGRLKKQTLRQSVPVPDFPLRFRVQSSCDYQRHKTSLDWNVAPSPRSCYEGSTRPDCAPFRCERQTSLQEAWRSANQKHSH